MSVKTEFGIDLKSKLVEGIDIVNKPVSSTLGPSGRTVLIENPDGSIKITKDGVSVAQSISTLEDPVANIGAQLLKQVSQKAADKAGDGTTTATLLAAVMVKEGVKTISQGSNPVEVKLGIDRAVRKVVDHLKGMSRDIGSEEQIQQVATISSNNDEQIGKLITQALSKAGVDGIVTIEESKTGETNLEVVEGIHFDRGFKSPYFVTDNNLLQAILEKPLILLYDDIIMSAKQLLPFLQYTGTKRVPLLIIAKDIDGEALATCLFNKQNGAIKVAAVKAPGFGDRQKDMLEDIAILTGATVISKERGELLEKIPNPIPDGILGEARLVTVSKDSTTIIDTKGDIVKIKERLQSIKTQIDNAKSHFEIEQLQQRLGRMVGGVSIINVGGLSEVEMKEKKDRVDDALHATKAAIAEGVVPGGGMALINCLDAIKDEDYPTTDQKLGAEIVRKALKAPFRQILENAGVEEPYSILADIRSEISDVYNQPFDNDRPDQRLADWEGYNVKTKRLENFLHSGVLDPTKVTRTALENAASVAGTVLTTESVIYTIKTNESKADDGPDMSQYM